MSILMGDLLEMIGKAVHQAQEALEQKALSTFWKGFTGDDELTPLTKTLIIPRSREEQTRKVTVSIPALLHHHSLRLNHVTVKLKAKVNHGSDGLTVELASTKEDADEGQLSEMELVFNLDGPAEGISRVTDRMNEQI